ncbi:Werner syndrome ATP-dependent helicase [Favolaschia claudopus]|uniref:DNA 3'-5' helicase n=1 Tax=Favolaschia claudopus TaxID=2862362 RepID=A0AAV9ZLR6_9AGAR
MDPLETPLPLSRFAFNAFRSLSPTFMATLTPAERLIALEAFLCLDIASKGKMAPRELQIRSAIAARQGKDLIVRSGTGTGKTLAMILPVLMLPKGSVVITVAPLRLIQDNHVSEFSKYGITSVAINSYTPYYSRILAVDQKTLQISPLYRLSCGPYKGHIPKFATLVHDPAWAKKIHLLQIDEAHFIASTGQGQGDESAFRPAFSDLGQRLRVHLPSTTPCAAFSATMPSKTMAVVMKTLRMDPESTVKVLLSTNRPNLVYSTISMNGTTKNLSNLDFLAPQPFPTDYLPPRCVVFIDDKKRAAEVEEYLNTRLPPDLASKRPFRKYHSGMSKQYLEQIAALFKSGEILGLIATECVSNGFDVADIRLIVLLGVAKSVDEGDQRGGRGGGDGLECLVLTIAERWAFENLAANNPDHKPGNKEERTNRSSIEYASTKLCKRKFLADYNEDTTAEALLCDGPCCDNDDPSFDLSDFLLGFSVDEESDSDLPAKKPRRKYRPVVAREPLDDAIRSWRDTTHEADLVLKSFPKSYIISNKSIGLLARERPQTFRIPADITTFLNETSDWHSRHALDILTLIHIHDSRRRVLDSDDSTSASDSENGVCFGAIWSRTI